MSLPGPAAATFTCELAELDQEILVTVTGDLDTAVTGEFRGCMEDAAAAGKPLFLDLTAVTFIDGAGYRAITAAGGAATVTIFTQCPLTATVLRAVPATAVRVLLS